MAVNFITFGKDKYHLHLVMEQWCRDNVGIGEWSSYRDAPWRDQTIRWTIYSMFGNTTFTFFDPQDLTAFKIRWDGA